MAVLGRNCDVSKLISKQLCDEGQNEDGASWAETWKGKVIQDNMLCKWEKSFKGKVLMKRKLLTETSFLSLYRNYQTPM